MNASREQRLKLAQRRMLRKIVKVGWRPMQDYDWSEDESNEEAGSGTSSDTDICETRVQWMRRAKTIAEGVARKTKVTDWVEWQRKRK